MNTDSKAIKKITILDWDDTLFPSSYFEKQILKGIPTYDKEVPVLLSEEEKQHFNSLDQIVYELLSMCLELDGVYIISNASTQWVDYSCSKYLPKSYELIRDEIPIVSARDAHEKNNPSEGSKWKIVSFKSIIQSILNDDRTSKLHMLSIGDSALERDAFFKAAKESEHCVPKSIKLLPHPSLSQLIEELTMIKNSFDKFSNSPNGFDFMIAAK